MTCFSLKHRIEWVIQVVTQLVEVKKDGGIIRQLEVVLTIFIGESSWLSILASTFFHLMQGKFITPGITKIWLFKRTKVSAKTSTVHC